MKSPKGFGKNYFTFSSILAHSSETKLQSQDASASSFLYHKQDLNDIDLEEDNPPLDLEQSILLTHKKPCHCNLFYSLKTKLTLLCNIYIPRCPYYTTCFAFRRTGVHPPLILI